MGRLSTAATRSPSRRGEHTREVANAHTVNMSTFEEGSGRVMYVASALERVRRPFLSWLYNFNGSPFPRFRPHRPALRALLPYVSGTADCALSSSRSRSGDELVGFGTPRGRSSIGTSHRWLPRLNQEDYPDTWISPWCSHEINQQDWPCIFEKEDRPSRISSSADAVAVLIRMRVFYGYDRGPCRTRIQVLPTWSDHRGNE